MQIAEKIPRNRLEALAHEEYVRQFPGPVHPEPPASVNAEAATNVDGPVTFAFRGKQYVLPRVPFEEGVTLHELQFRIARPESTEDYRGACREAVAIMGRLARRRGWRGRLRWLLPNPFRRASEGEISEVLDFFWLCRTGLRFPAWLDRTIARAKRTGSVASTSSRTAARDTVESPPRGVTTSTG